MVHSFVNEREVHSELKIISKMYVDFDVLW